MELDYGTIVTALNLKMMMMTSIFIAYDSINFKKKKGIYKYEQSAQSPFNRLLQKSRGLHSVSACRHDLSIYRSMPAGVAQSSHAFVGGTLSTWAR